MKLAYREYGQGQPLIILHGLFGQSDNWNTLAKNFADRGFRVFTVDQRNHGLSPHSNEWNYELMAGDLNEFIADHALKNSILLGHSMGAKTVMFFQKNYPTIAGKLIIADMAARAYPPHHASVFEALQAVDFDFVSTRKDVEQIMSGYIKDFGTLQFLLKNIYWKDTVNNKMDWRFNLSVIIKNYDSIMVQVPFFNSHVPSLIIRGEKSDYVNPQDLEEFKKRFTNMQLVTIAGAGHWVHAERPKEFFEAVINFITN